MRYATNWAVLAGVLTAMGLGLTGCETVRDWRGAEAADTAEPASATAETSACATCASGEACAVKKQIVQPIEAAHGKAAYDALGAAGKVVMAEFDVDFGGGDLLAGTMWFDTVVGRSRMELDNGATVVFDGETCWVSEGAAEIPYGYRFHALTWPYFLAAPFKLSDDGVSHELMQDVPLTAARSSIASKLTFEAGVGDAPDDWYIVFPNPNDRSLAALAYIVTYGGTSADEAAEKPSIVFYTEPVTVEGVTFATELIFHYWDEVNGVQGEPKGNMSVSSLAFVDAPAGAFDKPAGATEATLPGDADQESAETTATESDPPAAPTADDTPDAPVMPDAPDAPEAPEVPDTPTVPAAPKGEDLPQTPDLPTLEDAAAGESADASLSDTVESAVESATEATGDVVESAVEAVQEVAEDAVDAVTPAE